MDSFCGLQADIVQQDRISRIGAHAVELRRVEDGQCVEVVGAVGLVQRSKRCVRPAQRRLIEGRGIGGLR